MCEPPYFTLSLKTSGWFISYSAIPRFKNPEICELRWVYLMFVEENGAVDGYEWNISEILKSPCEQDSNKGLCMV